MQTFTMPTVGTAYDVSLIDALVVSPDSNPVRFFERNLDPLTTNKHGHFATNKHRYPQPEKQKALPKERPLQTTKRSYTSCASSVISAAFSNREIGQPSFAFLASSSNFSFSMLATFARVVK